MPDDRVELNISHESTPEPNLSDYIPSDHQKHLTTLRALRLHAGQPDDELRSLNEVSEEQVKLLEHQVEAAYRALFEMDGKALFADEVGLGKTIETGIVLKEMHYRDTVDSVLVLTPAQLAKQWQGELREKFGLDFICNYDSDFVDFASHDRVISSIDTAKSERYRHQVVSKDWDVLVLDEAHYVKNEETDRYDLIRDLSYDYAFFLTATPIQNEVSDLYNIVSLLRPGVFGTYEGFRRRFVDDQQETLDNRKELQEKLREVMVRNTRDDTDIDFTDREIETKRFEPTQEETELYDAVSEYVQEEYSQNAGQKLVLMTLQKEVVSSPEALKRTAEKQMEEGTAVESRIRGIIEKADAVDEVTKLQRLDEIVAEARENVEKGRVIVFTQFRATQRAVIDRLQEQGDTTHEFNGSLSSEEKEDVVDNFREEGGVMVTTDSMSEGRNLQFCNVMVNYDLPWNPMRVEQRIGRVHRIGQDRRVYIFNLALKDTVEEYVLDKLYHKIDLFEQSVGELSSILTRLEDSGEGFEEEVFELLVNADSEVNLENNFEEMAVDLNEQKEIANKVEEFNTDVFSSFELGGDDD